MTRSTPSRRPGATVAALALLLVTAASAGAQTATPLRFGVGYVANAPDQMAGGSLMVVTSRKIGLYVDAKFNIDAASRDEQFDATRTALQVENEVDGVIYIDSQDSYQSFNAAAVYEVNPSLSVYAGGGIARMTRYRQYKDPAEQLGLAGFFWVEGPDEAQTLTNVLVGLFLRVSPRVSLQTGYESQPKGITVGASLRFPKQ